MTRAQAFGRYELLHRISAGGMAEVFRATHLPSGTSVALKRILPEIAEDDEFIKMFEDEARIASSLEHPHIARCLDFGRVDNAWFISFEFVDGKDLRTLFDRASRTGEQPPVWFAVHVFSRIGEGLAYAHARKDPTTGAPVSIVHRDVSPQNIVVSYGGDVKLIDFGIAKAVGKLSRTQVGTIKGKFGYMSPEQVNGLEVDHRADIFSLGICLWELLTRKRLFSADNELLVLEKIKNMRIEAPSVYNPEVPPELDRIVLKALAKNMDERYRAARDLYRDLNHLAQSINVVATREQIAQYMRRAFPEAAPVRPADVPARAIHAGGSTERGGGVGGLDVRQETGVMADNKGGSDLDIFEGLAKKNTRPPAPSSMPGAPRTQPPMPMPPPRNAMDPAKKTLVGIQSPPSSSPMRAAPRTAPPPPPGRGTLPQIAPPPARLSKPPPPLSVRPNGNGAPSAAPPAPPPAQAKGPAMDMDWDDEDEATHIFDKADDGSKSEAAPRPAAGQPTPPPPSVKKSTLLGMTMPMAQSPYQPPASSRGSAPPPPPTSGRPPPPPPSGVGSAFARVSSVPSATPGPSGFPPPPTINPSAPPLAMQPALNQGPRPPSAAPAPRMEPVQASDYPAPMPRAPNRMEATALVRPPASRTGMFVAIALFLLALAGGAVAIYFFVLSKPGKLTVNVTDGAGAALQRAEIFVDGQKKCDSTPCIIVDLASGQHTVKVMAQGFEQPSDQIANIEARGESTLSFIVASAAPKETTKKVASNVTSLKVSGKQTGVKLYVDDKEIGPLPQELTDITAGSHKIKIAGDRYAAVEKEVVLKENEATDLGEQSLKVTRGKATITLATQGAKVYLVKGTERREVTDPPKSVDIPTSETWSIEASKTGFNDFKQAISFEDGQAEKTFAINLEVKGAPVPTASTTNTVAQVPPTAPTHTTAPTVPTAVPTAPATTATQTATAATTAPAATGEAWLNINSLPPSMCFLDGRPLGMTPRAKVQVTPGGHTVKFVNAELNVTRTVSVTVGAGETKLAAAKLN